MCKSLWVSKNDGVSYLRPLISTTTSKSCTSPFLIRFVTLLESMFFVDLRDELHKIVCNVGFAIWIALLKESDIVEWIL